MDGSTMIWGMRRNDTYRQPVLRKERGLRAPNGYANRRPSAQRLGVQRAKRAGLSSLLGLLGET